MDQCLAESAVAATRSSRLARASQAVIEAAIEVWAGLSRAAMNRRVLHRLSTLSARELKDIGLTPQDVSDASFTRSGDAIELLIGRRDERRLARAARGRW